MILVIGSNVTLMFKPNDIRRGDISKEMIEYISCNVNEVHRHSPSRSSDVEVALLTVG